MRYPPRHKDDTRTRIVRAASRGFREHGLAGLGIAAVMGELGLTHGGFYAHFAGKDALVIEACRRALAESWDPLDRMHGKTPGAVVGRIAASYLSPAHRQGRAGGCPIAALGPEIARCGPAVRRAVARDVNARLDRLAGLMPGRTAARRRDAATLLIASLVGTIVLSRLLPDREGLRCLAVSRRMIARAASTAESRRAARPAAGRRTPATAPRSRRRPPSP